MKKTTLKTRGRTFKGKVVSSKAQKTVTVEWNRRVYVPKFERYHDKRSKVKAHNPPEMDAKEGDTVIIKECRPISKTKKFVVVEVLKDESSKG
ncbi:TPA: 30S ribosomal protein S17 [Candidatus Woesearchaeota archaeon]|nr:30S ribosomal protein S17P [archaeon GW2011_AR15]AJS11582.1 30S ribosomal protein S17P [uncultured archaeon]AJS11876.1 30S ribosomal protein S17P [uncultured archaeon]MBS3103856.1 30S ribosomal protein S17 [Candidatus Woesearchaeota archaeon]HIH40818.1 30S ribosomal protein S17 [Candidatus Woesearchaeota archaeon]